MPKIFAKGAKWFADHGINGGKGLRSWSVSGRVKKPGVILAPAGITARELIELAGGMEDGQTFKAYLPGGASGGVLPASLADLPLDFGTLDKYGSFVGSHAIVIFSDRDDIGAVVLNLLRFFKDESCGQCTPCRVGCDKAVALLERRRLGCGASRMSLPKPCATPRFAGWARLRPMPSSPPWSISRMSGPDGGGWSTGSILDWTLQGPTISETMRP